MFKSCEDCHFAPVVLTPLQRRPALPCPPHYVRVVGRLQRQHRVEVGRRGVVLPQTPVGGAQAPLRDKPLDRGWNTLCNTLIQARRGCVCGWREGSAFPHPVVYPVTSATDVRQAWK